MVIPLSSRRFVVVGAGIAGLTVARELALRRARVTVLERGRIACREATGAATPASVGVLTAPRRGWSPLRRLQQLAHHDYPVFTRRLAEETGLDVGFRVRGSLRLERRPPRERSRQKLETSYREAGCPARWLSAGEMRDRVPGLSGEFSTALEIPAEGVVDPLRLLEALELSCRQQGVEIRTGVGSTRVVDVREPVCEPERGAPVAGAEVVLAAGAWSGATLSLGRENSEVPPVLPLKPIRGQAMEVSCDFSEDIPNLRFRPLDGDKDFHVIGRPGGLAWVGSTVEDAGFAAEVTPAGLDELRGALRDVLPGTAEAAAVGAWAGLRPQALLRGGPFVGRLPGSRSVWVHCGHYRSGVLLSPLTARLLVHALAGDHDALRGEGFDEEALGALRVDR